jgi:uncharacterized RDD family membrane protein YckC
MEIPEGNVWFYIRDHQQQGPVGLFELRKLFEQGILTEDSFVWHKDLDSWYMAKALGFYPESVSQTESEEINYAEGWVEVGKDTYPYGRPMVRYLARFFDLSLFSLFVITFVSIFHPKFILDSSAFFIFMMSVILYILAEAIIISVFGNTLGKTLLNARLKTVTGEPIDFFTALKRSIFVNAAGMGFGVPFINILCFLFSYRDLKKHGLTTWDKQIGTVVLYGRVSTARLLFVSLFPISLLIAGIII